MALARVTAPGAASLLDALDPEQRAAATLPDGPAQIIAPAGSGKTTTLIARLGVLDLHDGTAFEVSAISGGDDRQHLDDVTAPEYTRTSP